MKSKGATAKRSKSGALTEQELSVLGVFIDFAEEGTDAIARYLIHVGISDSDIGPAGDVQAAILRHYRLADGSFDMNAVGGDLARWPPIAARIRELKAAASSDLRSAQR